jgi:bacillithiol system protein YtxJ
MAWIQLISEEQFEEAIHRSETKPQFFFKHSTRCIISKMALKEFERTGVVNSIIADFYLLDLLNYRSISNEISERLNIVHQSPQGILLSKNKVVYLETHEKIDGIKVLNVLDKIS